MFTKIKNFFNKKRRTTTAKTVDKLTNGLSPEDILRYKNLIPNLVYEFSDENMSNKKRTKSFSKKNIILDLSENTLTRSNSGKLIKLIKNEEKEKNEKTSIDRNYFKNTRKRETSMYSTRNVRKGLFDGDKSNLRKSLVPNLNRIQAQRFGKSGEIMPKRSQKRKMTIDPQDTFQAKHISFEFSNRIMELNDTKEKLEEYQEKMRKTQLRYYVFKKITEYKSNLRVHFLKYRNIVQIMSALDDKIDEKKENDIELEKEKISLLKNIIKNRVFKEQKELNKYLLRFYYNSKYAAGIDNLNKIIKQNKDENQNNEIKKEEEKKELTPEEIEKAKRKRNKELRDLFYNKIRERQKWLHDHFVKFYYRGLLLAMKTGNIKNNTSSNQTTTNNETNNNNTNQQTENNQTNSNSAELDLINKTSSEIDTININQEIGKKEENKEEEKKEEEKKDKKTAVNRIRDRSKGLRRLLSERNKEKNNILRKYFFKFLSNGILLSLKKTTLRSSKTLTSINEEGNKDENNPEDKKEEEESNWIIEEKKRRKLEEEQRQKELWEKKSKKLILIFNKKDQILCLAQRSRLQKWNLRAKILAIADLTIGFKKPKRLKTRKKTKRYDDKKKANGDKNEDENEEKKEDN